VFLPYNQLFVKNEEISCLFIFNNNLIIIELFECNFSVVSGGGLQYFLTNFAYCQLIDEGDSAGRSRAEEDAQARNN
jgi:hypothetical protein